MAAAKEGLAKMESKIEIVRWIDPDVWGFRAWSVLFSIARRIKSETEKEWLLMVKMLADVLPCHTCRLCCGKFIQKHPPEGQNPVKWLCELRTEIASRNLKSNDCNRLDRCISEKCGTPDDKFMVNRFRMRESLPMLWIMDVFLFLSCVAMTLNLSDDDAKSRLTWHTFARYISRLVPFSLKLPRMPEDGHVSVDDALLWIMSSPLCPVPALISILSTITVKMREIPADAKLLSK